MFAQLFHGHKHLQPIVGDNIFHYYDVIKPIGHGNSHVFMIQHNITKIYYAMKEIVIPSMDDVDQILNNEIKLLKYISQHNHDNIIQFHDSCILIQKFNEYTTNVLGYIIMELANEGSLDSFDKYTFNKDELYTFVDQSFSVFQFLQEIKVAHCDIKPENILISSIKPLKIKICDVGSGQYLSASNTQSGILTGTISFMSPESLRAIQENSNKKDINLYISDVFSFGLVLLYVVTTKKFNTIQRSEYSNNDEAFQNILDQYVDLIQSDESIRKITKLMLQVDQTKRKDFIFLSKKWQELKQKTPKISVLFTPPQKPTLQNIKQQNFDQSYNDFNFNIEESQINNQNQTFDNKNNSQKRRSNIFTISPGKKVYKKGASSVPKQATIFQKETSRSLSRQNNNQQKIPFTLSPLKIQTKRTKQLDPEEFTDGQFRQTYQGEYIQIKNISFLQLISCQPQKLSPLKKIRLRGFSKQ